MRLVRYIWEIPRALLQALLFDPIACAIHDPDTVMRRVLILKSFGHGCANSELRLRFQLPLDRWPLASRARLASLLCTHAVSRASSRLGVGCFLSSLGVLVHFHSVISICLDFHQNHQPVAIDKAKATLCQNLDVGEDDSQVQNMILSSACSAASPSRRFVLSHNEGSR